MAFFLFNAGVAVSRGLLFARGPMRRSLNISAATFSATIVRELVLLAPMALAASGCLKLNGLFESSGSASQRDSNTGSTASEHPAKTSHTQAKSGVGATAQAEGNSPTTKGAQGKHGESNTSSSGTDQPSSSAQGPQTHGSSESDAGQESGSGSDVRFDLGTVPNPGGKQELLACEIDFLFVVDNSSSMESEQLKLTDSVPEFIHTLQRTTPQGKDLHIGVVTTDKFEASPEGCRFVGALLSQVEKRVVQSDGTEKRVLEKCGPYQSGLNFMTQEDELSRTFGCAARPGTFGAPDERQVGALLGALDPNNGKAGGCNQGFIREKALLVVVFVTDADVGFDKGTPAQWHEKVLAIKGNDPNKAVVVSIVAPPTNVCDPGDSSISIGDGLIDFTQQFGDRGIVGDVCSPNYRSSFKKATQVIDFACEELQHPAR